MSNLDIISILNSHNAELGLKSLSLDSVGGGQPFPQSSLIGLKVFVYFNLHKKVWSVRHKGIVIAHLTHLTLSNVEYRVSQAGRQRVLTEKKKNVHAGVYGTITSLTDITTIATAKVTYNPYKYSSFVTAKGDYLQPVFNSKIAIMAVNNKIPSVFKELS
jgi:hypothetical protein